MRIKLPVDLISSFNEKVSITPPRPFQSALFHFHDPVPISLTYPDSS